MILPHINHYYISYHSNIITELTGCSSAIPQMTIAAGHDFLLRSKNPLKIEYLRIIKDQVGDGDDELI